jgi:hypothetical protein
MLYEKEWSNPGIKSQLVQDRVDSQIVEFELDSKSNGSP